MFLRISFVDFWCFDGLGLYRKPKRVCVNGPTQSLNRVRRLHRFSSFFFLVPVESILLRGPTRVFTRNRDLSRPLLESVGSL